MWRGVTAVSILRGNLTIIASVSLRKYDGLFLNSHFPNFISTILSFSKLLPENSRNTKNIQGFVNTLDILGICMVC